MTYIHSKENLMLWQVCPASLHFLTGKFCIVVEGEGFMSLTDNPTYRLHTRGKKGRLPQESLEKNVATFLAYVILFPTVTFYLPMPALCKGEAVEDLAALFSAVALRPELYPNLRIPAEFVPYFKEMRELRFPSNPIDLEEQAEITEAPSKHAADLWQQLKNLLIVLEQSDSETKDFVTFNLKTYIHESEKA